MDQIKTAYNKSYYQRNREKILARVRKSRAGKSQPSKVVELFHSPPSSSSRVQKRRRNFQYPALGHVLVAMLSAAITSYLIRESARFFLSVEGGWIESYLKALVLEGSCVVLCLYPGRSLVSRFGARTLLLAIYGFSIWAISGGAVQKAFAEHRLIEMHRSSVQELETEIERTRSVQDRLLSLNRISAARSYEPGVQAVQRKLSSEREALVQAPEQNALWNTLATLIGFRILIMLSNLYCVGLLGRKRT